jgi:hypothetical protein
LLVWLRWRPVAVSWLTDGSSKQRCCCFKRWREMLLLLPLSSSVSFFFLFFCCQVVSLFVLPALLFVSLSNRPLFRTSQYSFLPLSISFPLFCILYVLSFFSPSLVLVLRAIFIGKRGAGASLSPPYCCAWGHRVSWPVGVAGRAQLP